MKFTLILLLKFVFYLVDKIRNLTHSENLKLVSVDDIYFSNFFELNCSSFTNYNGQGRTKKTWREIEMVGLTNGFIDKKVMWW